MLPSISNPFFVILFCISSPQTYGLEASDYEKYRKAAEQGDAYAQYNLASCYAMGEGVVKDEAEAVKWFRKAAEQGDARSQSNLGVSYYSGQGVEKNVAEAVKWYRKAAEQGDASAQSGLGLCYGNGEGVVKNEIEGYKWELLAAAQGNEIAKKNMVNTESRLSPAQRAEGQRLAQEWEARHANRESDQGAERRPVAAAAGDDPKRDLLLLTTGRASRVPFTFSSAKSEAVSTRTTFKEMSTLAIRAEMDQLLRFKSISPVSIQFFHVSEESENDAFNFHLHHLIFLL